MKPFTLGILGAGQLGRMTAIAAAQLGIKSHIYAPDAAGSPAAEVAAFATTAAYDDKAALLKFANSVDAVTSEFENVPASAMTLLSEHVPASPGAKALGVAQNRLAEKTLARDLGIMVPDFWAIRSEAALASALNEIQGKGVLKTTTMGYDGKGQMRVSTGDDAASIFAQMGSDELILEAFVPFAYEVSFLVGRTAGGQISHFPATQNHHENGILATSIAPADCPEAVVKSGQKAAEDLASALELTGVMAMESFITKEGQLIFNEIAPRPHNSFHWTIEGCETSQFTQLARIMAGLPLGATEARGIWKMQNLLGQHMGDVSDHLHKSGRALHLYGKAEAKTDRKMGHVTWPLNL